MACSSIVVPKPSLEIPVVSIESINPSLPSLGLVQITRSRHPKSFSSSEVPLILIFEFCFTLVSLALTRLKDVLELLGDAGAIQATISEYFATIHKWMPIFSQKRLTRNMANPLWEAGPDLALLFLCMKLVISRPQDGIESSQNPIYVSAKRFIALMEATGTASLLMLQANILVAWFEYGQAIYPAAWMSAGWCTRYGNMLGINGNEHTTDLIGRPVSK